MILFLNFNMNNTRNIGSEVAISDESSKTSEHSKKQISTSDEIITNHEEAVDEMRTIDASDEGFINEAEGINNNGEKFVNESDSSCHAPGVSARIRIAIGWQLF